MLLERLINQLKSDEGFRSSPYQDTVGVFTIGYGTTHINGYKVDKNWKAIDKDIAEKWLYYNLPDAIKQAKSFVNNFSELSNLQQESLVNMAYQLGSRQSQFLKLRNAIEAGLWGVAFKECLDSKWARQTPNRAKRVAEAFLL